jgi:CBS domain-containing protein
MSAVPPSELRRRSSSSSVFGPMRSSRLAELVDAAAAEAGQGLGENRVNQSPTTAEFGISARSATASLASLASLPKDDAQGHESRKVIELGPRPPLLVEVGSSVREAARRMASANVDVALVVLAGALRGILTDTDVARKLIAEGRDPDGTNVEVIMSADPRCVPEDATAVTALGTMMEHRFRHLPVVSTLDFRVIGVLDAAKVLYDAMVHIDQLQLGSTIKLSTLLPLPPPIATGGARGEVNGIRSHAALGLPVGASACRSPC